MAKKPKTTDVRKIQLSDVKKAYSKERRRIQKQIRRMENRAYDVPDLLPDIPKRITKASVNRLKKITTEYLYSKSRYIDTETGEILTGEQARKQERKEAAQRAAQTRKERRRESATPPKQPVTPPAEVDYVDFTNQIFTVFQMEMTQIYGRNERLFNYLTRWFNMARARYGDEDFAEALEQSKSEGMWPGWEGVSDTEILVGKLTGILELIGGSAGGREEIIESLEGAEDWDIPD